MSGIARSRLAEERKGEVSRCARHLSTSPSALADSPRGSLTLRPERSHFVLFNFLTRRLLLLLICLFYIHPTNLPPLTFSLAQGSPSRLLRSPRDVGRRVRLRRHMSPRGATPSTCSLCMLKHIGVLWLDDGGGEGGGVKETQRIASVPTPSEVFLSFYISPVRVSLINRFC